MDRDRAVSFFYTGKLEGIMIVLQELSVEDGFTEFPTKNYISTKLTELNLSDYIEPIFSEYYSEESH